jgi:hypothetical protein
MKEIAIVYYEKVCSVNITRIRSSLEQMNYSVSLCPITEKHTFFSYFSDFQNNLPNLILTIDLAGFELKTTGENVAYNRLPTNIIHYISQMKEDYADELNHLFAISSLFLSVDPNCIRFIQNQCKKIYTSRLISSLEKELPYVLASLDWRI